MDTKGEIPISIGGANKVEAVTTFNRSAEGTLRQSSLEFWDRARPHDILSFSNAVLRINTKGQDGFSDRVRYLQDEIKQVVSAKHIPRDERHTRLLHYLSTHDNQFLMDVFERVLNPANHLAKTDLNINDLAYSIVQHAQAPERGLRKILPTEVAFQGSSFQRILTYSFLELSPDELALRIKELSEVVNLFAKILGGKDAASPKYQRETYGFILGAASSAIALLSARDSQAADYVSPAPDWLDFYQGIDGFTWNQGQVVGCIQSGVYNLGHPYKEFGVLINGQNKIYTPKAVIFDDGKVFYRLQVPFKVGDHYEEAKVEGDMSQRPHPKPLHSETIKISKFLEGTNFLANQGILPWEGRAFFHLADFRQASLAIAGGQYPLGVFVKDIGEHIQALKVPVLKQASA